jgi:hypothetical protein
MEIKTGVDTLKSIVKAISEGSKRSGNWGHESTKGKQGGSRAGTGGLDKFIKGGGQLDNPDNAIKEYGKIFSNWKQENAEKMILVAKDGQYIVVGSGDKGSISISLKQINQILLDKGLGFSSLAHVVHNHNEGEAPSKGDVTAYKAFMAAGFGGDFQIYTPKTGRIQNTPYNLEGDK